MNGLLSLFFLLSAQFAAVQDSTAAAEAVQDSAAAAKAVQDSAAVRNDTLLTDDKLPGSVIVLGHRVPIYAIKPMPSEKVSSSNVIDTLPTSVPGVKVLLYNDNTWRYSKTDEYIADNAVFAENWDASSSDPYKVPVDSLPETWPVWLVDSLGSYHMPQTGRVTSKWGYRHGRLHQGIDISLPTGTPLFAVFDGKVRISKSVKGGYGNLVVIRHNNGLETFYGHMSRRNVKPGDIVHAGDTIGFSGNTGRSTGPHLHFETRYKGLTFDPQRIINFETGELRQRMMVLKRRYFNASNRYDQNFDEEFLLVEDDARALEEKRKKDAEEARKAMVYHKVRSGENLSVIARKYRTSVNNICRLNGIKPNAILKVGKTLRVR